MNALRITTWQSALRDCVADRYHRPFAWGVHDCCTFAADCVAAVTGADPMRDLRGLYDDAISAARITRVLALDGLLAARLGPEITPLLAQTGDVGLTGHGTCAVWLGSAWMAPGREHLQALPDGAVLRAWRCCSG